MVFNPKQGITQRKCLICKLKNLYFAKRALSSKTLYDTFRKKKSTMQWRFLTLNKNKIAEVVICTVENICALRRLWRYVIRLFRFPNTFSYVQRDAVLIFVLSVSQKVRSAPFCCKIQICHLGNGALLTFWLQLYVRKVLENREPNELHIATVSEELDNIVAISLLRREVATKTLSDEFGATYTQP